MSPRFKIKEDGIWLEDELLSLTEICNLLNELDKLAKDNLDEYEHIRSLEQENILLKEKLIGVNNLIECMMSKIND